MTEFTLSLLSARRWLFEVTFYLFTGFHVTNVMLLYIYAVLACGTQAARLALRVPDNSDPPSQPYVHMDSGGFRRMINLQVVNNPACAICCTWQPTTIHLLIALDL